MNKTQINDGIFMVSMNIHDMLFESMWELPDGVSMNSYIVKGEKTAIIDGVIGWDGVPETLYENLEEIDIDPETIDYLIVNHMEPDHSGWIEHFKKINTDFTIVTTEKGRELLLSFYGNDVDVKVVEDGDTIDLGGGRTLSFHPSPNVHWPETMMTYETSTKTLFPCDMYGAFGTMDVSYFDDEMTEEDEAFFEKETIRYFSNVMTTYAPMVRRAIRKTRELDIDMVAPGHGPIYRKHPEKIVDIYERCTEYAKGKGKREVTVLWGSMYGMTGKAVEHAINVLEREGVTVNNIRVPQTSQSEMVTSVFKSAGVIIAGSTYEYKMFPPVAHAIDELGRKKIKGKTAYHFGSYGWSGGAKKDLEKIFDTYKMNWDITDSYEFEGAPFEADYDKVEEGVMNLIEKMKDNII